MSYLTLHLHDLPGKHEMEPYSFHASEYPVMKLWWDGEVLEVMDTSGQVWRLTWDEPDGQWVKTEKVGVQDQL